MMKLLVISVTYHKPQIRLSDTSMHMTLNTMNGVVEGSLTLSPYKSIRSKVGWIVPLISPLYF
jgi:hypothetical protein